MIQTYIEVLKKWKRWDGRARRREYWLYQICNSLVLIVLCTVATTFSALELTTPSVFAWVLTVGYSLLQTLPSIAVLIRRLHDTNRSGGFYFIQLIPYIGGTWLFVLTLLPGTVGVNKYGPDPKDTFIPHDGATSFGQYPDFTGR